MKNVKFLTTLSLMLITGFVMGQDSQREDRSKLQLGLKAGANYSNIWDSKTNDLRADGRFGWVGGAFLRIPIAPFLGLQPEFLLSQKGFKGQGMLDGESYNISRRTTYIDVPLMLAVKPSDFISILAGVQYSYLMKQSDTFDGSVNSATVEQTFAADDFRKNIFGFIIGADVNINHVVIGARACWDFQNNSGDGDTTTPRYKNTWVQATVGYSFF